MNFDYESKRAQSEALKTIITEDTVHINLKGVDAYDELNIANIIMLSNNENPIRVDQYDRRYCVMTTEKKQDVQYYNFLYNEIEH